MKCSSLALLVTSAVLPSVLADGSQGPLSDEVEAIADIPPIGFGTWNLDRSNATEVVEAAIHAGYRHIDCAAIYGNEKEVGEGIRLGMKKAGIKRHEIWITSKLWNNAHDPEQVPKALNKTLTDLQLSHLDLYLMHWPVASQDGKNSITYLPTWQAMSHLTKPAPSPGNPNPSHALARHVGVSNFSPAELTTLLPIHKPYAHQYETHPYLPQAVFLKTHKTLGIHVTAYSPLGNANPIYTSYRKGLSAEAVPPLLQNPVVEGIARERHCTPAQVALRWGIGRGTSVIPKSAHKERIEENWESVGCNLKDSDYEALEALPVKRFNNPSKGWGVPLYGGLEDSEAGVVGGAVQTTDVKGWMSRVASALGLEGTIERALGRMQRVEL